MKKSQYVLFLLMALALLISCDVAGSSSSDGDSGLVDDGTDDNGLQIPVDRSIQVVDSSGNLVGYLLDFDGRICKLITESGYILYFDFNGSNAGAKNLPDLFFSGTDGSGDILAKDFNDVGTVWYGKMVFGYGTRFFIPALEAGESNITTEELCSEGNITTQSCYGYNNATSNTELYNNTETHMSFIGFYLEEVSMTDIGLPASINGSLEIVIDDGENATPATAEEPN